jgi:hypothetical protein
MFCIYSPKKSQYFASGWLEIEFHISHDSIIKRPFEDQTMQILSSLKVIIRSIKMRIASGLRDWLPRHLLLSIVLLAFVQGVIYMLIIPPWWHYDEPGHFEYAWLAANRPGWPQIGQYDQTMRRDVAYSLMQFGWYKIRNFHPDLSGSAPISIGVPQVGDVPGYYFLASLPLRFVHHADILVQYYAARSISFLLYLLIILTTWYALGEILPKGHPLRWMVTIFLALLPAFLDTMTAVNNDVSAVLAASLFLWASLSIMKRGYSIQRLLFLGLTLAFCYLSKNTAWFAFLLVPFVLVLGLLRGRFIRLSLGVILTAILIAIFATLQWEAPLAWHQSLGQSSDLRVKSAVAPLGNYVFQIDDTGINIPSQTLQLLSPDVANLIRGKTVTLGAWIWADQATQLPSPYINFLTSQGLFVNSPQTIFEIDTKPMFYHLVFQVPEDADDATLYIRLASNEHNKIFMDGLVLASGEYDNTPPHFSDPDGTRGVWAGQNFQNLIRNGSAEQGAFQFRPWTDKLNVRLSKSGVDLPLFISTIQDWKGNGWYYREAFATLFRTFWASLAGDKVVLPNKYINDLLIFLTVIGIAGAGHLVWSKRKNIRWDIVFILGMSLLIPWMLAITRGVSGFLIENPLYPWSRYAYPAIIPTAILLCGGWWEWVNMLKTKIRFANEILNVIFLGGVFALSILAAVDAIKAFHQVGVTLPYQFLLK